MRGAAVVPKLDHGACPSLQDTEYHGAANALKWTTRLIASTVKEQSHMPGILSLGKKNSLGGKG